MSAADKRQAELKKRSRKGPKAISAKLKTAAEVLLRHEGKSVMDGLAENCRAGEVQSAKLLYEMAQGTKEAEDDFRSLAFGLDEE